jgi:hypothetical protein
MPFRSTFAAAPTIHTHCITDSVLHSDHSTQNSENVIAACFPRRQLQPARSRGFFPAWSSLTPP